MKEAVLTWLDSGCDPIQGVSLLERVGGNPLIIRMAKVNPAKNVSRVRDELCRMFAIVRGWQPKGKQPVKPAGKSFREEFPFLQDPMCPVELKALVTDKFSSFYRYRELHRELFDCTNPKECARIAGYLINNYLENRSIYAELDFYKQNKTLLGKHPIFKQFVKMKELRKKSIKDLVKRQEQLEHNIWRIESEIKKGDKPHLKAEREERIRTKQEELAEVNRLLTE
jgi:hypothetical protein